MHQIPTRPATRCECLRCGAHSLVPVGFLTYSRCQVCGGFELRPVGHQPEGAERR